MPGSRISSVEHAALALGVRGYRVTSISDALFSIIATITAVPLAASVAENRKNDDMEQNVTDAIHQSAIPLLYCLLTFNIVSRTQLFHCVIFDKVDRASALVVMANTMFMLFVSFIPMGQTMFSNASLASGPFDPGAYEGASIFFVALLSCIRFSGALLVYLLPLRDNAFRLCLRRRRLVQEFSGGLFFACLSATPIYLFADERKDWGFPLFWALLAISYRMSKVISLVTIRRYWGYSDEMAERTRDFKSKRYSRSRVDAYTDGVLAISATLIILDVGSCENGGSVGMIGECSDINVYDYIVDRRSQLSAYVVSFVLICAKLWARHASMWKHVKQCGILLHFLNTQACCFIALLPYSIELMMSYDETDEQRRHSVIFWLCNVLLVSLTILLMGAWIFSKHHSLPRDEAERPKRSATKKWTVGSGYLLPFWTVCGILAATFDKDGERAWRIAIGLQIIVHPLSQVFVFWRYMVAYKDEVKAAEEEGGQQSLLGREGDDDNDDDDDDGDDDFFRGDVDADWSGRATGSGGGSLTEGLLDKKDRRESRGLGGHSTIARGYYKLGNDDLDYVKEREEENKKESETTLNASPEESSLENYAAAPKKKGILYKPPEGNIVERKTDGGDGGGWGKEARQKEFRSQRSVSFDRNTFAGVRTDKEVREQEAKGLLKQEEEEKKRLLMKQEEQRKLREQEVRLCQGEAKTTRSEATS